MEYSSLIQELEDTKAQLKKQKTLKEMYINKGKETTRELERLRKYSDEATLSQAKIATQVRDNTRQKKKKDLHKDYEELKVAHLINDEKHQADLQAEKDKNHLLQKELDLITAELHSEQQKNSLLHDKLDTVSQGYESQVISVRQQAESLQRELDKEVKAHVDTVASDLQIITNLKAEQDNLRQKMTEEINNQVETLQHELQKEAQQRELLQQQLEELKMAQTQSQDQFTAELHAEQQKNDLLRDKLDTVSQGYESEVISVRQQAESLQRELDEEVKAHVDTVASDSQMITNLKAEQDVLRQKMTEEINSLLQNTQEKEELHERQLEELKTQLAVQTSLNLELSTELKALKEAEVPKEKPSEQEIIDSAAALELLDVIQVSEETNPGKPKKSSWKRVRHFLGLRKPQRWKK